MAKQTVLWLQAQAEQGDGAVRVREWLSGDGHARALG